MRRYLPVTSRAAWHALEKCCTLLPALGLLGTECACEHMTCACNGRPCRLGHSLFQPSHLLMFHLAGLWASLPLLCPRWHSHLWGKKYGTCYEGQVAARLPHFLLLRDILPRYFLFLGLCRRQPLQLVAVVPGPVRNTGHHCERYASAIHLHMFTGIESVLARRDHRRHMLEAKQLIERP